MRYKILIILFLVALTAGCTQDTREFKEIKIPGHGAQVYSFSYDIRESVKVSTSGESAIKNFMDSNDKFSIIFNGTNLTDNAYFRIVLIDMGRIPTYYSYEGKIKEFDYFYFNETNQWYHNSEKIDIPNLTQPVIWLVGPSETKDTSVELVGNILYLRGASYKDLVLAGDKLSLIVMGIDQNWVDALVRAS